VSGTLVLDRDGLSKLVHRTPELERELAAIEMTEAITVLTDGFVPDEVYDRGAKVAAQQAGFGGFVRDEDDRAVSLGPFQDPDQVRRVVGRRDALDRNASWKEHKIITTTRLLTGPAHRNQPVTSTDVSGEPT
jgi:hypothetical protein